MENEKVYHFLRRYLNLEGYKLDAQELKIQLLSHPSYPSLHSLTGVLTHFGIDNVAAQLDPSSEILQQLPDRFLCTLNNASNLFMVTKGLDGLSLGDFDNDSITFSTEDFLKSWSGIAVLLSKEQEFNKGVEKKTLVYRFRYQLFLTALCIVFFAQLPTLQVSVHFLFSLFGLIISYLIVKQELGDSSGILNKICGNETSNGCAAVLGSSGNTIFKHIKLSYLSGAYFTGLALLDTAHVLVFVDVIPYIYLLSLLAFPITIYSLYYQGRIVKKWCRLCLMIVGVLWIQGAVLFGNNLTFLDQGAQLKDILVILFLVVMGVFSWYVLQKSAEESSEFTTLKMMSNKFKRNFKVFDALIQRNNIVSTQINNQQAPELVFGNPNAPVQILLVTNPLCHYCKLAHSEMETLYLNNKEHINLTIRFSIDSTAKESNVYKVSERLLELYGQNIDHCFKALNEVFVASEDLKVWLKKWGVSKENANDRLLEQQRQWCLENGFDFTPVLLLNGRKYPDEYERSELAFFIEELVEQIKDSEQR